MFCLLNVVGAALTEPNSAYVAAAGSVHVDYAGGKTRHELGTSTTGQANVSLG